MSRLFLCASGATVVGAALVLGFSGCGGSRSSGNTSAATSIVTTTMPRVMSAVDERIARRAQLRLTDLPKGWKQGSRPGSRQTGCAALEAFKAAAAARQRSPDFVSTYFNNTQTEAVVYIFSDVSSAKHEFSQVSAETTRLCLDHARVKAAAEAAKKEHKDLKFSTTSGQLPMRQFGDESALGRLTITATDTGGHKAKLLLDTVFARVGRGIAILSFLQPPTPITPYNNAIRNRLAKVLVGRLQAAFKLSTARG